MAYHLSDEEEFRPPMTPAVRWIIAINVAVFFLQLMLIGTKDTLRWLAFDAHALGARPWTVVTYMFVHAGAWHILANLWLLYVFGPRLERAFGAWRFTSYYLWCGLGGWLAHYVITPGGGYLLGASAAVFGVLLAYAMRWPDDEVQVFPFFVTLKVRWLVVILVAINLLFGLTTATATTGVAYFAHLGGFAAGLLWLYAASAPGIERLRQRVSAVPDEPDEPPRAVPRPPTRARERLSEADEAIARSNAAVAQQPEHAVPLVTRIGKRKSEELDLVLDKISRLGLDSLSPDERRLLEEMSKRLRER
jgi:membrane associated rhomboid family serine protease